MVYTTSTSFAQRGSETASLQGEAEYNLQKKVFTAKETNYRYDGQKYRTTMKIFDDMVENMAQLLKFLDMLDWEIELDSDDIVQYVLLVYTDCYWSRDILLDAQNVLDKEILDPLGRFKQTMYKYLVKYLANIDNWTKDLIDTIEDTRMTNQLGPSPLKFTFTTCKAG